MAVLGALIVRKDVWQSVSSVLIPDSFSILAHQRIYAKIASLRESGCTADPVTLKSWFSSDDNLNDCGGVDYLITLAECAAGGPLTALEYARLIRDLWQRRKLIAISDEIAARAGSTDCADTADDQIYQCIADIKALNGTCVGWTALSDIERTDVEFLWPARLVANRINLIAGMGDVGKDVFCASLAACVTTGRPWPDGAEGCEPGIVGIVSPEDEASNTIGPRLDAAGCDQSRVRIWTSSRQPSPNDAKDLSLLIVSPLINLMDGKKEMNREQDVREFLARWQETNVTIVGTAHLNKKNDLQVVQRILGASGLANFVRSVWSIQRDNDDETLRLFMRLKANLTPDTVTGLQFRIQHVGPRQQSITCTWCGTTNKHADDVMTSRNGSKKENAGSWLVRFLRENGETASNAILAAAETAGYTSSSIRQAKQRNPSISDFRVGFGGKTFWRLDSDSPPA